MKEEILKILNDAIKEITEEKVPLTDRKDIKINELKNNAISFMCFENILLKVTPLKTKMFIEIRKIDNIDIEELGKIYNDVRYTEDSLYVKIYIDNVNEIEKIKEQIKMLYIYLYNNEPIETFGCCSRYIECSDNMKCVNPDKKMARGCLYKENLKNGKIFYGKNKNC